MVTVIVSVLLSLAFLAVLFAIFFLIGKIVKVSDSMKVIEGQVRTLDEIKERIARGDRTQEILRERLENTHRSIENLKTTYDARKKLEEESREMIKRLESVIAGSYSKGNAGENILREAFKLFPPEMLVSNFAVGGKVVEFGLVLPDKKVLPIDSKWPATNLVLDLDKEEDQEKRIHLIQRIEKEVQKRVKEVSAYVNPTVTVPWAVAAMPDSVFSVCRTSHIDAYRKQVILMSYSMTIPYILTFYGLNLQYSRSVDMENLEARLMDISRNLDAMEDILENKIARGSTMISNAYNEYKQRISKIRASITYLEKIEGEEQQLEISKEENSQLIEQQSIQSPEEDTIN